MQELFIIILSTSTGLLKMNKNITPVRLILKRQIKLSQKCGREWMGWRRI